jgi:RNA polymerase sigma factor (TIGR02999 family)
VNAAELLNSVYEQLRKLAAIKLAREPHGQTLNATALVHEAWLRLMKDVENPIVFQDRTHFLRTASTAMRRILVDRARAKLTAKRGGAPIRVELPDIAAPLPDDELLALDEALTQLALTKPDHAKLLELRYFTGLKSDEAAEALNVSAATADRMARYAKAWLALALTGEESVIPKND